MKNSVKDEGRKCLKMLVDDIEVTAKSEEGYQPVRIITNRGIVNGCYYPVKGAEKGAIWVGGVGGGWDSPARGLYPRLCQELMEEAIASLRVQYRHPILLEEIRPRRPGRAELLKGGRH